MLNDPKPGLRPIHNGSVSPLKPQLSVQPGDELVVSEDVAAQLLRAGFKDGAAPVTEATEPEPEASKPKRSRKTS